MVVERELDVGRHSVLWSLPATHYPLYCEIEVTETGVICLSVADGNCNSSTPPGVNIVGDVVTGFLNELPVVNDFESWIASKGGPGNIEYGELLEINDAYIGLANIGFTVTYPNVLTTADYYIGL